MCRYVNHTAKVSSTSSSRSLNCFRIFFTGNRSIVAAAASSAAAAKKEYQPLLSLTLQRTSPDVTMSYLQHHQVRFAATKLLVSQSHLHNSNRMKVSAACQLAVLKFVASQCHMSPDGSRFSLVLLKVKTPYVTKSYLQYLSCFSVWHVSQKDVATSHYSSRKKSAASLFKDDAISSMTFLLFELYRRIIHDLQAMFVTSNRLHLSPI